MRIVTRMTVVVHERRGGEYSESDVR